MVDDIKEDLIFGIKSATPIVMGYMPVGFALGVMASDIGLSPLEIAMMSLFVYAGSAQFIAVNMLEIGAAPIAIIITTFLVNLRHLLFSASLAPHFKNIHQKLIAFISFFITDESFAVSITDIEKRQPSPMYFLSLYITAYLSWVISTFLGNILGGFIPDTKALGFDFALPGMFLALLCMQLKNIKYGIVAIVAGALSLFFIHVIPGNWNVISATIIAAYLGVIIDK